jgi:hypothetical protein
LLPLTPENVAVGRIIAGALFLAFPRPLVRTWTGTEDRRSHVLGRAIGARDLALGLGALVALRRDASVRAWFEAALLSDAADAVVTVAAFRHLPRGGRWVVLAAEVTGASASRLAANSQTAH